MFPFSIAFFTFNFSLFSSFSHFFACLTKLFAVYFNWNIWSNNFSWLPPPMIVPNPKSQDSKKHRKSCNIWRKTRTIQAQTAAGVLMLSPHVPQTPQDRNPWILKHRTKTWNSIETTHTQNNQIRCTGNPKSRKSGPPLRTKKSHTTPSYNRTLRNTTRNNRNKNLGYRFSPKPEGIKRWEKAGKWSPSRRHWKSVHNWPKGRANMQGKHAQNPCTTPKQLTLFCERSDHRDDAGIEEETLILTKCTSKLESWSVNRYVVSKWAASAHVCRTINRIWRFHFEN